MRLIYKERFKSGGIYLKRENLTFLFLVLWAIMIFVYFTIWKNNKFLIISNIGLWLLFLYVNYKNNNEA